MRARALCACVGTFMIAHMAIAEQVKLIDLGAMAGHTVYTTGINSAGDVVGYTQNSSGNSEHGYRILAGQGPLGSQHLLAPLDGGGTQAVHINDYGQVAGASEKPASFGFERAVIWQPKSSNAVYLGGSMSWANGINNHGDIVGYDNAPVSHPVYWVPTHYDASGLADQWNMHDLATLPGYANGSAMAVNNANVNGHAQIVGWLGGSPGRAAFWEYGVSDWEAELLPELAGQPQIPGFLSCAYNVNDAGHAVGFSNDATGQRATLWERDANGWHVQDLGSAWSNAWGLGASGINNHDQVVGAGQTPDGLRAFLWDQSHGMRDLNKLNGVAGSGWTLQAASGINDKGWIVGYGLDPTGVSHAFLLAPIVPLPSAAWSGGALFALLAIVQQQRAAHDPEVRRNDPRTRH